MGIRIKVVLLISAISLSAFFGFGILMYNASALKDMSDTLTSKYTDSLVEENFANFRSFLRSIESSSGVSQALGEAFHTLRTKMPREDLQSTMVGAFATAYAREPYLLGGGAFYEPNAFYPEEFDFHLFASKKTPDANKPDQVAVEWTWDVKTHEEGWYLAALPKGWDRDKQRDNRYYWSELYADTSINVLMVSVCLPMHGESGRIMGVGTVDVSLSTLQKMVHSFPLPTPSAKIVAFSTVNHATFASSDSQSFDITPYPKGSWLQRLEGVTPGGALRDDTLDIEGQKYTLRAAAHDSGIGLAMLIPNSEMHQAVDSLQQGNLITAVAVCLFMLLITTGVVFAFRAWLMTPLGHVTAFASAIERGELNAQLRGVFQGEMGILSRAILNMVSFLQREMKNTAEKSETAAKMAEVAEQAKRDVEESLRGETARRERIMLAARQLAQVVDQVSGACRTISSGMEEIRVGSKGQHDRLQEIVQSMERVRGSVAEVVNSAVQAANAASNSMKEAENGAGIVAGTTESLRGIRGQAEDMVRHVSTLEEKSNAIGSIMTMIKDIADQTNLLALNAAIEAARAGDAGRGFAVVADEVRKLAEKTMNATGEVATAVTAIRTVSEENNQGMQAAMESIGKTADLAESSNQSLKAIVATAGETSEEVKQIAAAAEEESAAVGQISGAVEQVFTIVAQTSEQVEKIMPALKGLMQQAEQLQTIMAGLREN